MLGAGLQFGRRRVGEDDRFYSHHHHHHPAKATLNRHHQNNTTNLTKGAQSDDTTSSGRMMNDSDIQILQPEKPAMVSPASNLRRFLESVTPSVSSQLHSKRTIRGWRTSDMEHQPYYMLGDLWESFKEWSAYGAGVPLILNETDSVIQYYVPYLSGIQIYGDPSKSSMSSRRHIEDSDGDSFRDSSSEVSSDNEHERGSLHSPRERQGNHHPNGRISWQMEQLSLNDQHHVLQEGFSSDESDSASNQGCLLFEYLERNQPWGREPLTDKILDLAHHFPDLKTLRSCDLLPSSWLSVAWYPIYRIPMGPTLKDLDACFLTFHSLHTPMTGNQCEHPPVVSYPHGTDGPPVVSLPVFGLASYKFKSPLWVQNEQMLVSSLLQAADDWLSMLQVNHPDYLFFSRR
uniref:uncharacterized protein LOC122611309 n=1 Tax=Erigeron canadensis TaxID=72917 RepID=UPI001CB90D35|nr:uncharacterized protein LOC122611309 [Erigeron canadensis]